MRLPVNEVCAAFDLGTPLSRPLAARGGRLHSVWRLETDGGTYAVKILRPPAGLDETGWLRDYQRSFELERAAVEGGLPAPKPMPGPGGSWLAEVAGRQARAHEWVEGSPVPESEAAPALVGQVAALLARIHALGVPAEASAEAVLPVRRLEDWRAWETEVGELRGITSVMADVNEAVVEGRQLVRRPVLGHRDVNAKNIIAGRAGGLWLIDWELNGPVEPMLEAVGAALDWAGAFWWEPDPAVVAAFLEGYRAAGGEFPADADSRIFAYWLARAADFAQTCHRRALHGATSSERLRARRNATFMVRQLRRSLDARPRWLPLLLARRTQT